MHSSPLNNLDAKQRGRLMRSARKLGEVLGTTPHLAEIPPEVSIKLLPVGSRSSSRSCSRSPPPLSPASDKVIKLSRRCGSIFTHSQASSTSFSSAKSSVISLPIPQSSSASSSSSRNLCSAPKKSVPCRSADAHRPPPLVLHLNLVPLSPTDPRIVISPGTPSSKPDVFSAITPPMDDPLKQKQAAEAKRRKMTKVTRTFGENVPQELVFPVPKTSSRSLVPSSPRHHPRNLRNRTLSTNASYEPDTWKTGTLVSSQGSQVGWVGEWNRSDIREVQRHLRDLKAR